MKTFLRCVLLALTLFGQAAAAPTSLKLITPAGYLTNIPVLVRIEALDATGAPDRELWDADVTLSASAGFTLSTNRIILRNGVGSGLVALSGSGNATVTATLGALSANRTLASLTGNPVTSIGGTLSGNTTWNGVIRITNTVTVPAGTTLTIQSNTLVLIDGVASGTAGAGLIVNGAVSTEGTETHPVTITCGNAAHRWGQIRHDNAQPSTYHHTIITRAGRAPGEGHTGQAPVIRPDNSTIVFENCSLTDHAEANGTPGKIGYGINSDLTFRNCLLSRARTGPEIQGTALLATNCWFIDMRGPDDSDGIYLHGQQVGQQIKISHCVFAGGDDDGIDTLDSVVNVDNTILRDWNSVIEDAKAVSVFSGATHLRRCLITDSTVGVSAKTGVGSSVTVTINNSTIVNNLTNVLAQFKANAPGPIVDYRITNSVLWGGDAVQSDFAATNFTIVYSDLSEVWPGTGNLNSDPLFVNAGARNFRLLPGSPCINSGDPASPTDPDGSRADMGFFQAAASGLFASLSAPANNSTFTQPANLTLEASASSTSSTVTNVEFFQGTTKLGEDASAPYSFAWNNVSAGIYILTAVASDASGLRATSAPVNITVNNTGQPTTNTVIPLGSNWAFLDNGSDQGTNWSQRTFDSSSWSNGVAPLGYCTSACGYGIATTVSFGGVPNAKFITTYFRRSFNVANPAQVTGLVLNMIKDDGAVVYLNGVEVHRVNMPAGDITSATPAAGASNYPFEQTLLPAAALNALIAGANVLAIEVHQGNATSSDLALDAQLDLILSASTDLPPLVTVTAPANNTIFAAPASFTFNAAASDSDGSVTNVAFFANTTKLADDSTAPYSFSVAGLAAGSYALTAVARDSTGLSTTSAPVNIVVSANTAAPVVFAKTPAPGNLTSLTQITVTFSKDISGVNASDLLINGAPATGVTGSGSNYVFTFSQPAYGPVSITWTASPGITDLFTPPAAFNPNGVGATWSYALLDSTPPVVAGIDPTPGSGVTSLTSIALTFSEAVTGVNASDLLINAAPASALSGTGAGPYVFSFPQPPLGNIAVAWAPAHGILDETGNGFAGGAWSYTLDTNAAGVVISEIMYHPSSENVLEEYIELHNKGASAVNLNGWRLSAGVQFTFTNVSIPAGGYLVVAANTNAFAAKYPGVTNVVGNWTGFLNNSSEDIDLDNQFGARVDSVEYADEGDWAVRQRGDLDLGHRGWVWFKEPDGLGKSLELLNPNLSNNEGQNWAASRTTQGTPGRANSVLTNNLAPMILGTAHLPVVPRSTDSVVVTARIVDESPSGISVTLFHRVDAATPPAFSSMTMRDDGLSGDTAANDGLYSAVLPAQPNGSVVEFYIQATDQSGKSRTWPAPAIASADDGSGPTGQVANALYQVDDSTYTGTQPLYKIIMTETERAELAVIPSQSSLQGPNSQMNATFISIDGAGTFSHYLVGVRNRGHGSRTANPPNYHVAFRSDDAWKNVAGLNLNTRFTHLQHFGSILARKSGVDGADSVAVQVRVNNQNRASSGSPMFGSYAANEDISGDWSGNHFPDDGNGNIYRVVRDIAPPDFTYRGEDPNAYTNTFFKASNESENNWTDLIGMLRVVGINNATSFTTENVRQVVNVEQWMRHLAFMAIVNNRESGLNTGYNDDYFMYAGVNDPRFILSYWDLDTILGGGDSPGSTTSGIYDSTANNGSGQAMDRFLRWPDFEPIYIQTIRNLLNTTFEPNAFNASIDDQLGSYVPAATITSIKTWMSARRTYLLSILPEIGVTNAPIATITGTPRSPTPLTSATLTIGGSDVVSYRASIDGAAFGAETPVITPISLTGLANGIHSVAVIGKHAIGTWQAESNATLRTWVVNTAWPGVRLNEILAQNDSAVNHSGTFPDLIELFNESGSTVDISGLRLTDDAANPNKFTFPAGTTLAAGARLVVYANNPDATPGFHLGFSLDATGESLYLIDRASSSSAVLDAVTFGLQLPNLSIGRVNGGDWTLTQPTFGAANVAQSLGNPATLKINEWLAAGVPPTPDDFVELYNPDPLPVALGGLHLTDRPNGVPRLSEIGTLSFISGGGFRAFTADGKSSPADHANFGLSVEQGEIALTTAGGTVIDHVIYGPQQVGVSSGRCSDGALSQKALSIPTPGSPNACPPAPPTPLTVNLIPLTNIWRYEESGADLGTAWSATVFDDSSWLSGPALLGFDLSLNPPEPLRTALTVANGKITFYFRTHFNLPANINVSDLQLTHAIDDGAVFYLNGVEAGRFNMPAGAISFTTQASSSHEATTLETITISRTSLVAGDNVLAVEVHQQGANSSDIIFGLKLDAVIVTNTPGLAGIVINEVLANNANLEELDGTKPDWIELFNPSASAVDLADMSLTDDTLVPRRWVFPTGSFIPALGYLKIRFNGDLSASSTNTGFSLKASGGGVYLYNRPADGGAPASVVTYGLQAADWSLGRVPDGSTNWVLTLHTAGSANLAAALGNAATLKVNEWMAAPASGDDWIEIYNPNAQPVAIAGLWLSDNLANTKKYEIPARSFIGTGPGGFLRFWAANGTDADFTGFSLSAVTEDVVISTAAGTVIDGYHYLAQTPGVSEGRLPDGAAAVVKFPVTPTPGNANFLPLTSIVINEVIAHTDPPLEDAVELYNTTGDDIDIGGWYLSDSQDNLLKYRVPAGTIVPAGGFKVFYEYQFSGDNPGTPFSFSSAKGDQVYLSQSLSAGTVTGYRAFAEFDASENGVSFGRHQTSVGFDFTTLSARTFGSDTPATTNQFRTGTGKTNAYAKVGPVVINEIMYNQPGTNDALEFVELQNILGTPQPLFDPANPANTWRVRKGIDFDFPTNVTLPAGGFLLLVNFNPATDTTALANFRAVYPSLSTNIPLHGPYGGKLDNGGEPIELQKPDAPQTVPGPDFGTVPHIVVDRVVYSDVAPWPVSPDGTGDSLKRLVASLYGNDPANWSGGVPTPGAPNTAASGTNAPPVLAAIGNKTTVEGTLLTFTATATDTNVPAQTLTFSLDAGAPSGAAITPTGVFTWAPDESQGPGSFNLTVRVTDSGSPVLSDFEAITITVLETNNAPALTPIGNKSGTEGTLITFTASATDPDVPVQALTYSLDAGAPSGATITGGGVFTWTPTEAQGPGVYPVTVRVTDNGTPVRSTTETIQITVNEANLAPQLAAIGNKSIAEGSTLTFNVSATDADQPAQTLTFTLDAGAPAGAAITTGGAFTWTPTEAQGPSTNSVTIRVTDSGSPALSHAETIQIIVSEVNTAPVLAAIGNKSITEGSPLTFTATATDSDQPTNSLAFSLDAGAPAGASITSGGAFNWTPTLSQGPSNYVVTIRVTDNGNPALDDSESITLNVSKTAIQTTLVGFTNLWRYNVSGSNLLTAWKETAYDDSSWPTGRGVFHNETSSVIPAPTNTFLPLTGTAGGRITNYYFRTKFFLPADATGITLTATNALDDGAVIYLNGVEAQRINMPAGVSSATTFASSSWEANLLSVTNISATSLVPGENVLAVGVHQQSATSSDVVFGLAIGAVIPSQNPIAITQQPANVATTTGGSATFTVGVSGTSPFYQWLKNGSPIAGANSASFTIANAQASDAASYSVMISNLVNAVTSSTATLTVNAPANTPPVLAAIGNKTVNESNLLSFTATATDTDLPAQALTFTLDPGSPAGASITSAGAFTWTPHETNGPGVYTVTIRVTDNGSPAANDFETISVTVNEVNVPPVLATIGTKFVNEGATLAFTATATDPDRPAQALAFTLDSGSPAGATINATSGAFSWTPAIGHTPMTNTLTVRVTDNGSPAANDSETLNIIVVGTPRITSITNSAGAITIQWSSVPTRVYRVEYKSDLNDANWTQVGGNVTATGTTSSLTDAIAANVRRFYRVVLTN